MEGQRARPDHAGRAALEHWILACAAAVIYYALARAAPWFAVGGELTAALWPAAGFALAAVLLWGPAAAAGVLIGAFLAHERPLTAGAGGASAAAVAAALAGAVAGAQALFGARLLRRYSVPEDMPRSARDAAIFCALSPLIGLLGPLRELLALAAPGGAMPPGYMESRAALTWWVGDTVGLLVVTPLILAWAAPRRGALLPTASRTAEGLSAAALLAGAAWLGFAAPKERLLWASFPAVLWILFRFGSRASTAAVAALAALVMSLTAYDSFPVLGSTVRHSMLIASAYIGAVAATALLARALLEEREAAMKALFADERAARRRLADERRLFEHLPTGFAVLRLAQPGGDDGAFRIIEINPAGVRLAGREASGGYEGMTLKEFSPALCETGFPKTCLDVLRLRRIRPQSAQFTSLRVADEDFDVVVFALNEQDVGAAYANVSERNRTQRRQAEAALADRTAELARSNLELSQFAYVASHDLNAPLHKVKAFAKRLKAKIEPSLDDESRDYLRRMMRSVDGMQQLIDGLLALARVTTRGGAAEAVDLGALAKDVVEGLALAPHAGAVEIGPLPRIMADPLQMRQLLQNLISNGLKFQVPGGSPIVRVRGAARNDGFCELTISDNGIGIELKYAEKIFQPFQRLNSGFEYEGSGIGLTICRRIVERHGGSIAMASKPGHGSEFRIVLPLSQEGRLACQPQEKASR